MCSMSSEEYGVGNLIYTPQLYDKVNRLNADLPFYYNIAKNIKGKVLELGCGTGRLTIPLKEKGIDISGLDFTPSMLDEAKRKAKSRNLHIDFIPGDMRNLSLDEKFSLIFIPFNSLQNTYTIDDISKVFQTVEKHLKDDGIFVFDIFNPNIHFIVEGEKKYREFNKFKLDNGEEVVLSEKGKYDSATQTYRLNWRHKIGEKVIHNKLDMRCFYPLEMDLIVMCNHFKIVEKFGDFDSTKFNSESPKQIYICKKNEKKR